jgi:hypothetical protein
VGQQRQRRDVPGPDLRSQLPHSGGASGEQRLHQGSANASSLPFVGNSDRDVSGGRVIAVSHQPRDADRTILAGGRYDHEEKRHVVDAVHLVDETAEDWLGQVRHGR